MEEKRSLALLARYQTLRRLYFAYLVAAVLALVLFFVDKRATLVLLGASLLYHLAVIRPRSRAYQKEYVHVCAQRTLERYLDDAVHTAEPALDPAELREARLVADNGEKGSILCAEGGRGTHKGCPVRLGDVTFAHSFPMDGKTHHEFATGTWVTVELGRDTGLDWRLIGKRVMMKPSRDKMFRASQDLQLLRDPGPAWLAEDWLVLRRADTPDLPGEAFLKRARKLAGDTPGALAVCVRGDRLHVFITNRILGQKVSIREEPVEARVGRDMLPELGAVLEMADLL